MLKKLNNYYFYLCFKEGEIIKRNLILATFLLLVLISLGCATAADDIQSDANMAVDDNIDDEVSVMEDPDGGDSNTIAEEQLSDANEIGTFTDLKNEIDSAGNYYELTRDYAYNSDTDYNHRWGISLKMNLMLDGKGHTLNGNNASVIFSFFSDEEGLDLYKVTIKNINFINANGIERGRGGALDIERGPLYIVNCTFKDCCSGSGGAIFDYGSSTIENCTFINNHGSQGAAIYGSPNINNCTFINNSASSNGGALRLCRHCYLNNSAFYNNTSNGSGGAIFGSAFKFENSIFEGNIASGNGGAMYLTDNYFTLEVNNCTFKNNAANIDENQRNSFGGGAIYMNENKGLVTDSKFINNTGIKGGALYIWNYCTVKNTTFENNNATDCGGAYYGSGEISGSSFTNNTASLNGGALFGRVMLSDSTLTNNNASNGGAVYLTWGNVSNSKFFNNSASGNGGAAFLNISDVYGCQFSFNNASNGGAVYLANSTVNESQFYNNTAVNGAALYAIEGAVFNSQFVDNAAEVSGGAIDVVNALNITNVDFSGNTANDSPNDYDSENPQADIKITIDSVIEAVETSYVINYGGEYSIILHDYKGVPIADSIVSFVLNGVDLGNVTTDENGFARITFTPEILKAATAGTRNLVMSYAGTDYINPVTKTVGININKEALSVEAKTASYVINYGGYYSVTVKDSKGNPFSGRKITFVLNGKTVGTATTNVNGVAKIKLTASALKAAKYGTKNLVVKYGDSLYNSISKTVKVSIKKEKSKITAKKKTFKRALKVKKYTIALKNSKGKGIKKANVYLKVKGKTYKAKTNSKGKATFKIKNLKKRGKFTAKITYKTTAYYLKASKKVYLKVK